MNIARYSISYDAPLVWAIHDRESGNIIALLDDRYAENPRDERTLERHATIMAAALNAISGTIRGTNRRRQ